MSLQRPPTLDVWVSRRVCLSPMMKSCAKLFLIGLALAFPLHLISIYIEELLQSNETVLIEYGEIVPHENEPDTPPTKELAISVIPSRPGGPQEHEALTNMQVAQNMIAEGKPKKVQKLLEHAIALAPNHPDVLNAYGEFVESTKDLVKADHLYLKALIKSPQHAAARVNRGRTAALVEEIDSAVLTRIDEKRDVVATIPETNGALNRAKREAYFQHIYHTVGIEGNTMTLSQTRSIVETRMAVGGKSIAEHNEILGMDAALKFMNSTLINQRGRITIDNILEIHRRVLGFVDPTEGGFFRRTQVFVGDHVPPPPSNIPPLMRQFENWLNSWEPTTMHAVRYAALAHYKLVHIHPFNDGNGRTARLLMNLILMKAGFPPVIILKQDRYRYYETLEMANEGDVRPFVRFIAECTERTLDLFLWSTAEYSHAVPAIDLVKDFIHP